MKRLFHSKMRAVLIFVTLNDSDSSLQQPPPLKPVTMATRNALFPIFELQKFPNTYLRKVTKFQFNSFSSLGAAFKKPEDHLVVAFCMIIPYILQGVMMNVSKTGNTKSFPRHTL